MLAPGPGIKPPLFVLEGEVLTTGPPGKSLGYMALDKLLHIYELHTFFLKKKPNYLFGCLGCSAWDLFCIMQDLLLQCLDSPVEAHGLIVSAHKLSYSLACGILVTRPGIKIASPAFLLLLLRSHFSCVRLCETP